MRRSVYIRAPAGDVGNPYLTGYRRVARQPESKTQPLRLVSAIVRDYNKCLSRLRNVFLTCFLDTAATLLSGELR